MTLSHSYFVFACAPFHLAQVSLVDLNAVCSKSIGDGDGDGDGDGEMDDNVLVPCSGSPAEDYNP